MTNQMAEAGLFGIPNEEQEFFPEESVPESKTGIHACEHAVTGEMLLPDAFDAAEVLIASSDRFDDLCQEIIQTVMTFSRSVKESEQQLQEINAAFELKKRELIELYDIDVAAISLKQLVQTQQEQQAQIERLIADQHSLWEEERNRIEEEERAFLENLKNQRNREEEDYRRIRELRQREFEQELHGIRQKALARQEEKDSELFAREQALIEKEQELSRLMREMDVFLSQLELQGRLSEGIPAEYRKVPLSAKSGSFKPMQHPPDDGDASMLASVNEMSLALNRNMENAQENCIAKSESTLVQFSVKKPIST